MNDSSHNKTASRRLPGIIIGLTLGVFAVGILVVTALLRERLRRAVTDSESQVLHSVTAMLEQEAIAEFPATVMAEPSTQMAILLKATRLKGFVAARLYDAEGRFVSAFPVNARDGTLANRDFTRAAGRTPTTRFHRNFDPAIVLLEAPTVDLMPVLEVVVPLHLPNEDGLVGVAHYFMDAGELAQRFARLDRDLMIQAGAVFLLGGILIAGSLNWVFRRLQRANLLVAERTRNLLEANRELALATRASAVGSLTAHLLHELKSHLFGVRGMLPNSEEETTAANLAVAESCERMQGLVRQLLDVVRHEEGPETRYEVSISTIVQQALDTAAEVSRQRHVRVISEISFSGTVTNRAANLTSIILGHLVQNAVQASRQGNRVFVGGHLRKKQLWLSVSDHGPGFPEELRPWLFRPCNSSKEGGTGIGLALCKQLANHLDAELELVDSYDDGCRFQLRLPARHFTTGKDEKSLPELETLEQE